MCENCSGTFHGVYRLKIIICVRFSVYVFHAFAVSSRAQKLETVQASQNSLSSALRSFQIRPFSPTCAPPLLGPYTYVCTNIDIYLHKHTHPKHISGCTPCLVSCLISIAPAAHFYKSRRGFKPGFALYLFLHCRARMVGPGEG